MKNKNTSLKTGAVLEREREREREREQLNNKKMKTKKLFLAVAILIINSIFLILNCSAQNIGINSTGAAPNASAALDIDMNNAGLLIPRLTTAQATTLAAIPAAEGLMIFNTDTKCFQVFNTTWQNMFCTCTAAPATPGSITGTTSMCANSTGISYSIAAVTGATSYTWAAPAGSTITSGQGTTNILVNFGASSGNISVTATNSCGTSAASSLVITITASPTTANAGPDQNLICAATLTTLAGNAPGVGTGLWTLISGTATITTPSSPTSTLTGISGNVVLRWAISNSPCTASTDDVSIFPNACTTDDINTVLKLHMDVATFPDASASAHPVTVNGVQVDAQAKFCQSGLFDGTGDYLSVPDAVDWDFGSGNFTIDMWVQWTSVVTGSLAGHFTTGGQRSWYYFYHNVNGLTLDYSTDGSNGGSIPVSWTAVAGQWYHIAFVRNLDVLYFFVDGNQIGTGDLTGITLFNSASPLIIGSYGDLNQFHNGYIDEFRISKGIARWTGNFTPPTNPYCD